MTIKKGGAGRHGRRLGQMREKGATPAKKREEKIAPGQRWWKLPDEQIPGALAATIRHIQQQQASFEQQRQTCARLYGGMVPGSAFGISHDRVQTQHPSMTGRLTYNVISIVCDTLVSKITKENLSVQFVTSGGDYRQQRRAKKLSQFADGITHETKMDEKGPDAFRDALILNEGIIHTFEDWRTHRVVSERVIPSELYVDEVDGLYGTPTQLHRVRSIDREQLIEAFPKHRDAIWKCRDLGPDALGGRSDLLADTVPVGESWRLPTGVDENGDPNDDGRHLLYIANTVLNDENDDDRVWKKLRFPFSVFRWKPAVYGWHGISLAQELIGSQVEMNHLLLMLQRAFRMMAGFRIWMQAGTIPDQHFTDKIGTILHGPPGSAPPQFLTPPPVNPQYFQHIEAVKARAFEIARVSQLSAVGQKPAGLDSGEAQRTYHDIEAEGFSYAQKAYEAFRLDVVEQQIDVVRDIFSREKKYELRAPVSSSTVPGARFLRQIDWKQVKLDEDEYILRGYSTSSLPNSPAGRLATVQDLLKAGLVDPETGRKLLNFPDLARVESLLGAAEDWITFCLDEIVEHGKAQKPDPLMNLQMSKKLAMQEYALGAANKMEEEKLDLLRGWLAECDRLLAQAAQAAQPPPADPMAQPSPAHGMGVPGAPPVSPMLPPGAGAPAAAA